MGHLLHLHPITLSALIIFAMAAVKGGQAERLGAALMVVDWLCSTGSSAFLGVLMGEGVAVVPVDLAVAIDFLFSLGLLALALRFGKLWLGASLVLQGLMLAMHAMALSSDAPGFLLYAAVLNVTTCLLLFSLLLGTLAAWRRGVRRRRAAAAHVLQPLVAA